MKGLVVGGGSIGSRHLRNLSSLGIANLAFVEVDDRRRENLGREIGLVGFQNLEEGLSWKPEFVVIASPTHLHAEQALRVVRNKIPLFIEKPLASSREYLIELVDELNRQELVTLVGCNMRFHPGPAKVKELLEEEVLGKILFARIHVGSYLPEWRPQQDYRKSYSAHSAVGGGCLLDNIHEIDLARWYLGDIKQVTCMTEHLSSLEIDAEDVAALICRHKNGTLSEIHLDYVQRTYERGCQIVGESGTIFWDYIKRSVRWYDASTNTWKIFPHSMNWHTNEMYMDEMKHFLACVHAGEQTMLPVQDAVNVMQIVFAARQAAETGNSVII